MSVGATTEHLCQADYSNSGSSSTSPPPAAASTPTSPATRNCRPGAEPVGRDIYQMTYSTRSCVSFGLPSGYVGTSMARRTCRRPPRW
jgi:serine protease